MKIPSGEAEGVQLTVEAVSSRGVNHAPGSFSLSPAVHISFAGGVRRPSSHVSSAESVGLVGVGLHHSAKLGTKAAETLRSASGGVPAASGSAAATSERSERKREAVRSRWRSRCYIPHLRESNPPTSTNHVQRRLAGGSDE